MGAKEMPCFILCVPSGLWNLFTRKGKGWDWGGHVLRGDCPSPPLWCDVPRPFNSLNSKAVIGWGCFWDVWWYLGCSFVPDAVLVECPCSEDISDTSQEPSPPKTFAVTRCGSSHKPAVHMSPQLHGSDTGNHKGKLKACGKSSLSLVDY